MELDFAKTEGLIPAIVQDAVQGDVLMVGFMNQEAFEHTVRTGFVTFFSRSRQKLWTKGETSGNRMRVIRLRTDCDQDAILVAVEMEGLQAACHEGFRSCFFREWNDGGFAEFGERVFDPKTVYGSK